jgi:hypothetical protein
MVNEARAFANKYDADGDDDDKEEAEESYKSYSTGRY